MILHFKFRLFSKLPYRFAFQIRHTRMIISKFFFAVSFSVILFCSCVPQYTATRKTVDEKVQKNTGFSLSPQPGNNINRLPPNVNSADGINEDEAVSLALWNNPQLQSDLAAIAIAQADVRDAGIVANPLLRYLAPSGKLMASGYINFAFDFLFQRPKRIKASQTESERVAETATQRTFTLIRDVQNAYTDFLLSRERAGILAQNAQVRKEIAQLTHSRLINGDISELEAATFKADSASAVDESVKACLDTIIKKNTLVSLLGYTADTSIRFTETAFYADTQKIVQQTWMQLAFDYQPELKASQINMQAIAGRLGWERSRVFAFIGVLNFQHIDGNGGSNFFPNAFNPGIQAELPLLNRNQGKIARVKAELEQAAFQYVSTRQRIALEFLNNYSRYEKAWESYTTWNKGTIAALQETVTLSRSSYRNGDISYLPVLEGMRQLLNAQLRQAEIKADIRRSVANINFYIGNKWNQ